jgi:hypothetical protein
VRQNLPRGENLCGNNRSRSGSGSKKKKKTSSELTLERSEKKTRKQFECKS